ncbi:hypothetical protein HMPREF2528_07375 [Rothia sp. HMSC078H08]|uniref:DUF262 domain-containing protein n=1 Tax=Rothia sp. HMSC078H08 TaxID=1715008 RepID=UPI0008A61087|nr:DUF262 domain-containing protein [Rothia sp. HMSC078H08]OFN71363.1 hypothetical protein HMPREF2528_07375 [Rothia sp. HMSC078H08]
MDISAGESTIGKFLGNAEEILYIPRYQRSYSWTKENLKDLINDIENSKHTDNDHFIGAIIRCGRGNDSQWDIIDGQQRLTSISILLAALRDVHAEKSSHENKKNGSIQRYLTPNDYMGKVYYKISQEIGDECFIDNYKLIVEDKDEDERKAGFTTTTDAGQKVIDAYNYLKDEIRRIISEDIPVEKIADYRIEFSSDDTREIQVRLFLKKILHIKFVDIHMKNIVEAYRVFNTLNSRGVDLRQSDLIKSHILGHLHHENGVDVNRKKWESIVKTIVENNNKKDSTKMSEDDFFYHYLVSRGDAPGAKKRTSAEYERMVKTFDDADALLTNLAYEINLYRVIFDPDYKVPGESQRKRNNATWNESLKALNKFELSQPHPLIFAILRRYFNDNDKAVGTKAVNRIFALMENSHFILTAIHGESGNKFTNTYNSQAKKVFNLSRESGESVGNMQIDEVYEELKKRYSNLMKNLTQEVFVNEFVDKMDYSKDSGKMKYFLKKYQPETLGKPGDDLTVEHIVAQEKIDKIVEILCENLSKEDKIKERERVHKMIHSPGNLIILRYNDNQGVETEDINKKIEFYGTLSYASTLPAEISEFKNLSLEGADKTIINKIFQKIDERSRKMAEVAYAEIFSIEDKSVKNP